MMSDSEVTEGVCGRYDELDGLRALSVLGIVAFHLFPVSGLWFTVNLFFVISGFFITRNLLRAQRVAPWRHIADFYGRRIARIVPPYFLYLGLLFAAYLVCGEPALLPTYAVSLLTFSFNWTRAVPNWISSDYFVHFWSLAVEAQFYCIWPWIVLLCRPRLFPALCAGFVCLAPLWRYGYSQWLLARGIPLSHVADCVYWTTTGHLDAFAVGALVAISEGASGEQKRRWQRFGFCLLVVAGILNIVYLGAQYGYSPQLIASMGYPIYNTQAYQHIWAGSVLTISWGTLVWRLTEGAKDTWWFSRVLRTPWLIELGRVSYGMYIWHWAALLTLLAAFPVDSIVSRIVLLLPLSWLITYLIAKCSYNFFEAPLRRRFSR